MWENKHVEHFCSRRIYFQQLCSFYLNEDRSSALWSTVLEKEDVYTLGKCWAACEALDTACLWLGFLSNLQSLNGLQWYFNKAAGIHHQLSLTEKAERWKNVIIST